MAWITLEEAYAKHGIPNPVLRTWLKEGRVTGSTFGECWMVSDDSIFEYLEEYLPATDDEHLSTSLQKMKLALERELSVCSESFYVLKTLKECQPLFEAVIRELSYFLLKESDQKFFYDISMGKSMEKVACEYCLTYSEVRRKYKNIINCLRCKRGIVIGYRNRMLTYSIQCFNYESKLKTFEEAANKSLRDQELPTVIPPDILLLLSVPIEDLFPESRIIHVLHRYGVYTLEDLLRLTKKHGFRIINNFHGLGTHSRRSLKLHLLEKRLINQDGNSYLYPYLIV